MPFCSLSFFCVLFIFVFFSSYSSHISFPIISRTLEFTWKILTRNSALCLFVAKVYAVFLFLSLSFFFNVLLSTIFSCFYIII